MEIETQIPPKVSIVTHHHVINICCGIATLNIVTGGQRNSEYHTLLVGIATKNTMIGHRPTYNTIKNVLNNILAEERLFVLGI